MTRRTESKRNGESENESGNESGSGSVRRSASQTQKHNKTRTLPSQATQTYRGKTEPILRRSARKAAPGSWAVLRRLRPMGLLPVERRAW
jgi:hypothetical protein